jgi:class 3 adenylate cyclase
MGDENGLQSILGELEKNVREELKSNPEVVDSGTTLDLSKLPIVARRWMKVSRVMAVVADLKGSTKLGTGKRAASTASIYEAGTGNVVRIFDKFGADFLAIQGDGAFGLFWGERNFERAMSSAITIRTFSEDFVNQLEKKWPEGPVTGFKVGVAEGRLLVKRIGTPRNVNQQEPVWAGKPVNYAAKAAQTADRNEIIVTGSVWDRVEKNEYLAISCPCSNGPSLGIWKDVEIQNLPDNEPDAQGRLLMAGWCAIHGEEYCKAINEGKTKRDDVSHLRVALEKSQFANAIRENARLGREWRRNRSEGLR